MMRYLGKCNLSFDAYGGNFDLYFSKPGRFLLNSIKFTRSDKNIGSCFLVIEKQDDHYIILSQTRKDGPLNIKSTIVFSDAFKKCLEIEDIKKKYEERLVDYVPQIVRPIKLCNVRGYDPSQQNLGAKSYNSIEWKSCREEFARIFHLDTKSIFFCVTAGKSKPKLNKETRLRSRRVARFIRSIENTLKLKEQSLFYETNFVTVMEIIVAPFWLNHPLKRSLFTLFIRAGLLYDFNTDNVGAVLSSFDYAKQTQYAIKRFLNGYTNFASSLRNQPGWRDAFVDKTSSEVDTLLKKQ